MGRPVSMRSGGRRHDVKQIVRVCGAHHRPAHQRPDHDRQSQRLRAGTGNLAGGDDPRHPVRRQSAGSCNDRFDQRRRPPRRVPRPPISAPNHPRVMLANGSGPKRSAPRPPRPDQHGERAFQFAVLARFIPGRPFQPTSAISGPNRTKRLGVDVVAGVSPWQSKTRGTTSSAQGSVVLPNPMTKTRLMRARAMAPFRVDEALCQIRRTQDL